MVITRALRLEPWCCRLKGRALLSANQRLIQTQLAQQVFVFAFLQFCNVIYGEGIGGLESADRRFLDRIVFARPWGLIIL